MKTHVDNFLTQSLQGRGRCIISAMFNCSCNF